MYFQYHRLLYIALVFSANFLARQNQMKCSWKVTFIRSLFCSISLSWCATKDLMKQIENVFKNTRIVGVVHRMNVTCITGKSVSPCH